MIASVSRLAAWALASLAVLAPQGVHSAPPALVTGSQPEFIQGGPSVKVLRERKVNLDLGSLAKAAGDSSRVLEIRLFDDAVFHVHVQRTEATHSGGLAYAGPVLGSPFSSAVIVDNAGVVSAMLVAEGRRFSLQGSPDRGYTSREMVTYDRPDHPDKTRIDLAINKLVRKSVPGAKANPTRKPPPVAANDTDNIIDVMVVYTPAARIANLGPAQMNANVDAQIALTNTIYGNSNVVQRLRLVYKGEVVYTEVDYETDLERVTTVNDGFLDDVPILRNLYRADVVSLWGDYPVDCGLGWFMNNEAASFEKFAFSVAASPDCTGSGSYTFAHELGHNMGLAHDNYMDNDPSTVTPEAGGAAAPIAYAHGYVDLTNRFRTVLAYDDQCFDTLPPSPPPSCLRIPYFSNPAVNYNNSAFYASAVTAPTGIVDFANERQALNDTRETTQNFRQALADLTGPGIVTFLPTTFTVAEGGGSVVLTVGRHVGSTGAISVQYATGNGTAAAGSDYTLTSGTLNWADGETANKTIVVPILQDAVLEGTENFSVSLTDPTGGASIGSGGGASQTATVRITDDEPDAFPVTAMLPGGYVSPNVPNANTLSTVWSVDANEGYLSPTSLRSAQAYSPDGSFTVYGNSDLEYTGVFLAGNVSFFYKLSSYDGSLSGFEFMVDGVVMASSTGGEIFWTNVSQAITAGTHTLRWRFKNQLPFACADADPPPTGADGCADRLWVDSIVLPLARPFDLSAEGRTDLVWGNTDGRQAIWLMNGLAPTATQEVIGAGTGWSITNVGDLNGDGKGDLVWEHTDGRIALYLMDGTVPTTTQQILNAGGGWSITHMPDLNGDGKADLLFQNSNGTVAVWTMNGVTMTGGSSIIGAGTGWSVIKVGDFDGDGNDDLVWKHTDGRHAIWLMNGVSIKATNQILNAGGWTAIHTPDLNGDGRADIVWQHTDGTIAVWLMNGTVMSSGTGLLGAGSGWAVTRTGDFDGDGKADLFFLHTDGRAAIYLMNGIVPKQTTQILNAGGGWSAKRLGDLNGDGKADIVWQNVDGSVAIWLMDGTLMTSGTGLLGGGTGWSVSGVSQ